MFVCQTLRPFELRHWARVCINAFALSGSAEPRRAEGRAAMKMQLHLTEGDSGRQGAAKGREAADLDWSPGSQRPRRPP